MKLAVQSRVLRSSHEDDHCASAVFKYMCAMAVDLRHTQPVFACMDDKAKVLYAELGQPAYTGLRNWPSMAVAGHVPTTMDHDLTRGSFTPSVILLSQLLTEETGSFYQGQANVQRKDSMFMPSNP